MNAVRNFFTNWRANIVPIVLGAIALLAACAVCYAVIGMVIKSPAPTATEVPTLEATIAPESGNGSTGSNAGETPAPSADSTVTPQGSPTSIPPSATPTNTTVPPAATATLTDEQLYSACPTESLGKHPDSGQPLIFVKDPYPGVLCEYEVFFLDRDYKIDLVDGIQGNLVADWLHGKRYDAVTGKLLDACPTGSKCEGAWVMIGDGTVPAGSVYHIYVYADVNAAKARFLGSPNTKTADRQNSFACEYIVYSNNYNGEGTHDNDNLRVPAGVDANTGTVAGHTGCFGYDGTPKEAGIVETETNAIACEKPTDHNWVWRENSFWHYAGDPISFQAPTWIEKVLYEDSTNSNTDLTATSGEQVTSAVAAKAYCK